MHLVAHGLCCDGWQKCVHSATDHITTCRQQDIVTRITHVMQRGVHVCMMTVLLFKLLCNFRIIGVCCAYRSSTSLVPLGLMLLCGHSEGSWTQHLGWRCVAAQAQQCMLLCRQTCTVTADHLQAAARYSTCTAITKECEAWHVMWNDALLPQIYT
jgi:hypothetical protein